MGISSSKSTNKPIYASQITGAGDSLKSTFDSTLPKIQNATDQITGLIPGLVDQAQHGNPAVNAAQNYVTSTLGSDPTQSPYLDQLLNTSNNQVRNQSEASLGLKGLTGGSSYADIISRNIGNNDLSTRYTDYNNAMQRQAQAAAMAPSIAAGNLAPIASLLGVADAASNPLQAAAGYASGIGGLLGQYQKTKTTTPWGPMLMNGLSNAAQAYATGGFGGGGGGGGVTPNLSAFAGYKF